jgi:hypothetical protein
VGVLIIPFSVVLAWMMGQPLDLNFNSFEAGVYFFTVILAVVTLSDGTSNWLKGVLLLITYVLVAAGFWMHKVCAPDQAQHGSRANAACAGQLQCLCRLLVARYARCSHGLLHAFDPTLCAGHGLGARKRGRGAAQLAVPGSAWGRRLAANGHSAVVA